MGRFTRIVSLVPSTTETVFGLGRGDRLVGATRYCVMPDAAQTLPRVGGTKDADVSKILALHPDLVLANCEENTRATVDALEAAGVPVWAPLPRSVDDALSDLLVTSRFVDAEDAGARWHGDIIAERAALHAAARPFRFAWLIWRKPYMVAGDDSFVSRLLGEAGGVNAFHGRYPEVSVEALRDSRLDVALLSDEPFPFAPSHAEELANATGLPRKRVSLSDGRYTWHGTRIRDTMIDLRHLLPDWTRLDE